jgi:hypothetical protein
MPIVARAEVAVFPPIAGGAAPSSSSALVEGGARD